MAQNTPRTFLTRWLATFALVCVYCVSIVGASTLLLTASSTSADARGGGGGRWRRWWRTWRRWYARRRWIPRRRPGHWSRRRRGRSWRQGHGRGSAEAGAAASATERVGVYGAGCYWNQWGNRDLPVLLIVHAIRTSNKIRCAGQPAHLISFGDTGRAPLERLAGAAPSVYRHRFPEIRGIAQPGSAAVLGTAGRWFESSCPDQNLEFGSYD